MSETASGVVAAINAEQMNELRLLRQAKDIAEQCHLKIIDRTEGPHMSYLIRRQSGPWLSGGNIKLPYDTNINSTCEICLNSAYEVYLFMLGYERAHNETRLEQEMLG